MRACWQRPSIAVGCGAVLLVAGFVWHGELRVNDRSAPRNVGPAAPTPVVVRRDAAATKTPMSLRQGRVFDARGFLLVGAEIVPMQHAPVRSDGDGAFQFSVPVGSCVDVLVRSKGQLPRWLRSSEGDPDLLLAQLQPSAPWDAEPSPLPERRDLRGEGVVRDASGRALAGAFVTAIGSGLWARTDDLGRYTLPLPPGAVTLLVHDAGEALHVGGHALRSEPFVGSRDQGSVPLPELVAAPAAAIRGTVRDPRGVPMEGVPVQLRGEGLERRFASGPGGAFRVAGLLQGHYEVQALAFRGAIGSAVSVTLDRAVAELDLRLDAADEVRVRVVTATGVPVVGAFVASTIGGQRRGIAQADEAGIAMVPVAAARTEFDVRTAEQFAPCSVQRFDSEPPTLVVALP